MRLLHGITHALVTIPTQAEAKASNTYAVVDLCFGPGDDCAISGFRYTRDEQGAPIWQVPMVHVYRDGRMISTPIFKGSLLLETIRLASQAADRIKKDLGKVAWGKRYRVLKKETLIEDIPKE